MKIKGLWIYFNFGKKWEIDQWSVLEGFVVCKYHSHCIIHALAYFCICGFSGELFVKIAKDMITETAKGIQGLKF